MKKKRLLAILLALAMLVGMLPASVFAVEANTAAAEEAVAAAEDDVAAVDTTYTAVTLTSSNYSDYLTATSGTYVELTDYYYLVNGTYYQVYYSVTSAGENYSYTLYYTTDNGSNYTSITTLGGGPNSDNTATLYYLSSSDDGSDDEDDDDSTFESGGVTYTKYSVTYSSPYTWDTTYTDTYGTMEGYYYLLDGVLYQVYYQYSSASNNDTITLYYYYNGSYVEIGTLNYAGPNAGNSVDLYASPDADTDGGGTSAETDIDISAYDDDGVVYWDLDDKNETYATETNYISSVTLTNNTTNTTYSVTFGESTSTTLTWSGGTALKNIYDAEDGEEASNTATLTITPVDGYYVTSVVIVCAPYISAQSSRISPYSCSTYNSGNAFDQSFTLASASGSALTLSIEIDNKYFAHSGYLEEHGDEDEVYFILIEVAEVPTPAYVEYDYGNIVDYIEAYNEDNETSRTSTSFATASGWTDASDKNVYSDNQYSSTNTTGTQGGLINGGVLTDDTQFEYVFDKSGTTLNSNWKHYANSISSNAIKEAAAAGYVFAGWAVTYYTSATAAKATDSSSYNEYIISFSSSSIETMVAADSEVVVTGYVRLVAQWIKIDSAQVIDYGLDVELDVEEALLGDGFEAITGDVSSRTSTEDDYSSYTTKELDVDVAVTIADDDSDGSVTGSWGTITIPTTSTGSSTDGGTSTAADSSGDSTVTYSLTNAMSGVDDFDYTFKLTYGTSTTLISSQAGTLYIIPATSMYYEEDFLTTIGTWKSGSTTTNDTVTANGAFITYSLKSAYWIQVTDEKTEAAETQESGIVGTTDDSTYGADEYYLSNLGDSNGTSMYVDTSDYAASFSYTFTGTGTAIYTRTVGDDEEGAFIFVTIKNSSGYVVQEYIDTRIVGDVSGSTTLYNIPIYSTTDLDYGTYTVNVLVYAEGADVQPTYTTSSSDGSGTSYTRAYSKSTTTTTENEDGTTTDTTTYDYLYYVYEDSSCTKQLYYTVDSNGNSTEDTDSEGISTTETDYPVYYSDESGTSESYSVTTTSEDGTETSTTYYLAALYYLADDTSGGDFYLDGIRIYNPLGTSSDNVSSGNSEDDTWDIASAAYAEDDEANNQVINITQELEEQYEAGYTSSETFVTLTDYYGDIESATYTEDHPDNEIYLDSASSSGTTYSVSFYLAVEDANDTLDDYDVYIGLKAPDGTAGSVKINGTQVDVEGSADCYYLLDDYLENTTVTTIELKDEDGNTTKLYGYKVTITGNSGLIALTYIKITAGEAFVIGTDLNADTETETEELTTASVSTLLSAASASEEETVNTVYILSAAAYSEASEDNDDVTDEDMLDDDSMAVDPEDSEDEESTEPETEEDEESVFEPATFTASISYLKLLRYASITVKTSSDVSYITVNGTKVTGRSFGSSGTKTFSYTATRVSSGTTYEIIAYDSNGVASEPITVTAK